MEQKDFLTKPEMFDEENSLSLYDVLLPVWQSRLLIAAVTFLVLVLGVGGSRLLAKYKSEGFFQFGGPIPMQTEKAINEKPLGSGINIADYKRFSASFNSASRFEEFIQEAKLAGLHNVQDLRNAFASRDSITKLVEPVYPFTKLDAKELMDQPKDSSNNVIGLRINAEGSTPQEAQNTVRLLGRHVMDSIVYLIYSDTLRFKHADLAVKNTQLENQIIQLREKLEELQRKGAALKQIVTRYPSASVEGARQVISVTDDNAKFLSPVTHLMSTEVQASEANEQIVRAKREQQKILLQLEYFDRVNKFMDEHKSGIAILRGLEPIAVETFKKKDMNDEIVKEVSNVIKIDNENALSLYEEKSRFIAGPTLPEHRSSKLSVTLFASLVAGLVLSLLIVFGRLWWTNNRAKFDA